MSDKTIQKLDSYDAKGENLLQQDVFAVSHNETNDPVDYITYKVSVKTIEETISSDIYEAQKSRLSSDLALGNLAWANKVTTQLIDSSDKLDFKQAISRSTYGELALSDEHDLNLHDLAHKDEASLRLSALAHKAVLDLASAENLSGLIPLARINSKFGDLLSTDMAQLNLRALAHLDSVNLGSYGAPGGVHGKLDFQKGITNYHEYVLPQATASERGGINIGFYEGLTNLSKNYAVKLNGDGQAYVHVPWTNTNTTSSYYFTGSVNGFTVKDQDDQSQFVRVTPDIPNNITGSGHPNCLAVFATEGTLESGLSIGNDPTLFLRNDGTWAHINKASHLSAGLMSKEDKTKLDELENYDLPAAGNTSLGGVKVGYTTNGRLYAVKLDTNGNAFVHVPWTNTNTTSAYFFDDGTNGFTVYNQDHQSQFVKVTPDIPQNITGEGQDGCFAMFDGANRVKSGLKFGTDKLSFLRNDGTWAQVTKATSTSDGLMRKEDKSKLDGLQNYILQEATSESLGGIKIGYASKGRAYAVKLDTSGKAYVEVPWTDTNTTYSAGTGLKLTGTTFSIDSPESYQKHSDTPISELTGTVYSGSGTEAAVTWTSPGPCIVTVSTYLKTDISSCGHPYPRYVRFKKAESSSYQNVVTMRTKRNYATTLICKKNDQIQITGYCSNSHGTEYHITGTTLA